MKYLEYAWLLGASLLLLILITSWSESNGQERFVFILALGMSVAMYSFRRHRRKSFEQNEPPK